MSILPNRRKGHISTKALSRRLDGDLWEVNHVRWGNIQEMIKAKYVFNYQNPLKPSQVHQCVAVRIRKMTHSFDRVAVLPAKRYYELAQEGMPVRWQSTIGGDDPVVHLRQPVGDGKVKGQTFSVIRFVMETPDPYSWYTSLWSPYCLLPETWMARPPSKKTKHKFPLAEPKALLKAHNLAAEVQNRRLFFSPDHLAKVLVDPNDTRLNLSEFFVMKTR